MSRRLRIALCLGLPSAVLFFCCWSISAQIYSAEDATSALFDASGEAAEKWVVYLIGPRKLAYLIFVTLATLQLVIYAIRWRVTGGRTSALEFVTGFLKRYFALFVLVTILGTWMSLGGVIQEFWIAFAQQLTEVDALNPVQLADAGQVLALELLLNPNNLLHLLPFIGHSGALIVMLLFILSYAVLAIQAIRLTVENDFLIALGPIFWSFAAFGPTARITDNYLKLAFRNGIKFLVLYGLFDIGAELAEGWAEALNALSIFDPKAQIKVLIEHAIAAVAYGVIGMALPGYLASSLTELWAPGFESLMSLSKD